MLPIGGDAVWGDEHSAPDDRPDQNVTYGKFLSFRHLNSTQLPKKNLTVEQSREYLFNSTENWYSDAVLSSYSFGIAHTKKEVEANQKIPRKWSNPLETRLPKAPNMKIYCFYGIGKETERAYYYREDNEPGSKNDVMIDTQASFMNPDKDHVADRGVVMGEGDGTVNLLSTGYMCNKGWRMSRYNPSGIKITTYEMPHEPDRFSPRGGPNTGKFLDIYEREEETRS
jgi:phospholipid:diacylglycerol acyltransferase